MTNGITGPNSALSAQDAAIPTEVLRGGSHERDLETAMAIEMNHPHDVLKNNGIGSVTVGAWNYHLDPKLAVSNDFRSAAKGPDGMGFHTVDEAMSAATNRALDLQNRPTLPYDNEKQHAVVVGKNTETGKFFNYFVRGNWEESIGLQNGIANAKAQGSTTESHRVMHDQSIHTFCNSVDVGPMVDLLHKKGMEFAGLVTTRPTNRPPSPFEDLSKQPQHVVNLINKKHQLPASGDILPKLLQPEVARAVAYRDGAGAVALHRFEATRDGKHATLFLDTAYASK